MKHVAQNLAMSRDHNQLNARQTLWKIINKHAISNAAENTNNYFNKVLRLFTHNKSQHNVICRIYEKSVH